MLPLTAVLGLRPGRRVLAVGCGTGDEVLDMARVVAPAGLAVGVHPEPEPLWCALARAREADVPADFVLGEPHELPFPDGGFDAVHVQAGLPEAEDRPRAVAELSRVLAPGGTLSARAAGGLALARLFAEAGLEDLEVRHGASAPGGVLVTGRKPAAA